MGETSSMERKPNLNRVCFEKGKMEVGVCIKGRQYLLISFCHNGRDSKGDLESLSCTGSRLIWEISGPNFSLVLALLKTRTDLDSKDPFWLRPTGLDDPPSAMLTMQSMVPEQKTRNRSEPNPNQKQKLVLKNEKWAKETSRKNCECSLRVVSVLLSVASGPARPPVSAIYAKLLGGASVGC
ncbi:hypothetical protein VNO77_27493 [Canavalia gladiata]|uniref:Uncharacterized protein n=1 Tax=Canavalia gladiata TaxID=3824 RepID=A0AAN9Q749_CANGL